MAQPPDLYIVTGASRGLGLALASLLLARGDRVLAMSRRPSAALAGARLESWAADLADPLPVAERLAAWLAAQPPAPATLVNNAGVIPPPGPLAGTPLDDLSRAVRIDLEAPLVLCAAFLHATASWRTPRRVLNISSGLGRRAMSGSAAYCAAKAGIDQLSRALALEGVPAVALAPGVIDTDMQRQLRASDPALFGEQPRFAALKAGGHLDSPETAAAKVLAFLDRPGFGDLPVADVRAS